MRKAVWGAISLGVWALSLGWPIRDSPIRGVAVLHQLLGIGLLVGYLLISLDPPEASKRQRDLMIAGIVCSIGSFVLAIIPGQLPPLNVGARILAVGAAALPLWLAAGPVRPGFIAAAVLAAVTIVDALEQVGGVATSLHAYVAAASCFAVAALMHRPTLFTLEKKPPRVVVASNIISYTPQEKERIRARLEKRFRDGDIPEHVYLDKLQEIEER